MVTSYKDILFLLQPYAMNTIKIWRNMGVLRAYQWRRMDEGGEGTQPKKTKSPRALVTVKDTRTLVKGKQKKLGPGEARHTKRGRGPPPGTPRTTTTVGTQQLKGQ